MFFLLKKTASVTLTSIKKEVLLLNFDEYLLFKNIKLTAVKLHLLAVPFHDFMNTKGIPE